METTIQSLNVVGYLCEAGEKLNCHFTIEYLESSRTFVGNMTPLHARVTTIPQLVKELEKELPGVVVKLDQKNKDQPVIHLIEKPLAKKKDNVLERKVDLKYSGVVGNLCVELAKHVPGIGPGRGGFSHEAFSDHVTKVVIDVKKQPIRELLTRCVPLDRYTRIIWQAKTAMRDGKSTTTVRFYGPKQ